MHAEALDWVSRHATTRSGAVLDIGGRNINGSVRGLFPGAEPYVSLDIADGRGVDVVADASIWTPDREYDVVVCCETFEHTPAWPGILATAHKALKPGGRLIVTTAAPGRVPHSAADGGPLRSGEYYANVEPDALRDILAGCGFVDITVDHQPGPADVRATATR